MALYRKWRPSEFEDVKGQEHIVTTLKNQINADRVGHAYLFCGTRGTGKTSVAKLFAKAVNCEQPVDGSPCNECGSCKTINNQSSMNVIEIDAASNNGVDNIREIREEVQYSPSEGKYKVYIIDEVHMLSIGAFNALLKTLEEPPSYVIFILATTEAHKIPITILSRCQKYDFKRISIDTISKRLIDLMEKEKIDVEEKAIRYVAKAADGSMRDALSLLDQCIAFYLGQSLTYENVLEVLGAVDTAVFSQLLRSIQNQNTAAVMKTIEEVVMTGRELGQFITDFTWYLRNLLLLQNSGDDDEALDMSKESLELLKEEAKSIDAETLMRYIRILSELSNQLKYATQKRVIVELAFIKLCRPQMEQNYDSILERLRVLEEQIEKGVVMNATPAQAVQQPQVQVEQPKFNIEEELKKRFEPADAQALKDIINKWPGIVNSLPQPMRGYLTPAAITIGNTPSTINISYRPEQHMEKAYFDRQMNLDKLVEAVSQAVGKEVNMQCILQQEDKEATFENYDLNILNKLNIPVEFEH